MTNVWVPPSQRGQAAVASDPAPTPAVVPERTVKGPGRHVVTVKKLTDSSQKYPYLATCACQFQGRAKDETGINTIVQNHFVRNE